MGTATEHGVRPAVVDAVPLDGLHAHLLHEHHRPAHELAGLPLDAVHELEHFDVTVGLLQLDHSHAT